MATKDLQTLQVPSSDQLLRADESSDTEEPPTDKTDMVPLSCVRMSWEADRSWCLRILRLVNQYRLAFTQLAWCSTLGGAHSALGDEFKSHAEKAGLVSRQQLALAVAMGNPVMAATCKVYLALSLMQQGRVVQAGRIIRLQYKYALRQPAQQDDKLLMLCMSAWEKLQYLKLVQEGSERKRRRKDNEGEGLDSTR